MSTSSTSNLTGACFCGAVEIRCLVEAKSVVNCHCGQCRRLGGAAFTTWVSLPRQATTLSGTAALTAFAPTENCLRHFCKHCGSHVFTEDKRIPGILGVPAGVLTTAMRSIPSGHYFFDNKVEWLSCTDSLPKFGGDSGMESLIHS
jgi:hypothetical protein